MSSAPPVGNSGTTVAEPVRDRAPDCETFWTRYSPHHEFPLSSVASVAAHVVVGVLCVAVFANFWFNQPKEALPLDVVAVPGGGGDRKGDDGAKHHRNTEPGERRENVGQADNTKPEHGAKQQPDDLALPHPKPLPTKFNVNGRPTFVPPSSVQAFDDLGKQARRDLARGLRASKGKDGTGTGGGTGGGNGLGDGD